VLVLPRRAPVRSPAPAPVRLLAVVGLALGAFGACGGAGGAEGGPQAGCGPDRQERVDPASANHVLAGGAEPEYLTDPPTSGPHAPAPPRSGVLVEPLSPPEQVGHLEGGGVLLQHRGLPDDQRDALEELAGSGVVVVADPELPEPVVATAWTRKMVCATVDAGALARFVDDHLGGGPGTDG
jgi:hypothetical protein